MTYNRLQIKGIIPRESKTETGVGTVLQEHERLQHTLHRGRHRQTWAAKAAVSIVILSVFPKVESLAVSWHRKAMHSFLTRSSNLIYVSRH